MQLQLLNPLLRLPKNNGKWKIQHRVWNEVQKFRGNLDAISYKVANVKLQVFTIQ